MAKQTEESPEFKIFWCDVWRQHARHTDGRGLARDTFNKLVRNGADPQDIIDGAKWFFSTMKDKDREYVPLSSTWLNRECFIDMAEQYRAYEARRQARLASSQEQNVIRMSDEDRKAAVHRIMANAGARARVDV